MDHPPAPTLHVDRQGSDGEPVTPQATHERPESGAAPPARVEILVDGEGLEAVEAVTVRHGAPLSAIVELVATKAGYRVEEALLFVEDEAAPVELSLTVGESFPHHRKHHVHRVRQIEVVVNYNRASREHHYPPSTRVEMVLAWAVRAFGIDPSMAGEFELTLAGSEEELPSSAHIGRFVRHPQCRLELDLVRGTISNGGLP